MKNRRSRKETKTVSGGLLASACAYAAGLPDKRKKWRKRRKRVEALAGAAVRIINLVDDHRHAVFKNNS